MTEPELVAVDQVATTRYAPVEFVGSVGRTDGGRLFVDGKHLHAGDVLLARPQMIPGSYWRTGRVTVLGDDRGEVHVDLTSIVAICEGDYVYRIGKPTTPSLEERVAELERRSPVTEFDYADDRSAPRERLTKAFKALRDASARIVLLETALIKACGAITEPALQEELLAIAGSRPLAWQNDPEIDWTGIER